MIKIILMIIMFSISIATAQAPPDDPFIIKFPESLMKYLSDSARANYPDILRKAIESKNPNAYLYALLPDSIARQLPDSIEKFMKMTGEVMNRKMFTAQDLMELNRISDPQLSPNGQWLIYNLKASSTVYNKFFTDIFAISIDSQKLIQLTENESSDYNGRWTPDGKKIFFISTKSNSPQLYSMEFPNGKAQEITKIENGVDNVSISPDGKFYAFTSEVKLDKSIKDKYKNQNKANLRVYTKLPVRHWSEWTDENYSHLFIIPADGGDAKDLMIDEKFDTPLKPFGGGEQIAWSPESNEIAYVCKKVDNFVESTNSDVYIVNISTGKTKNISSSNKGYDLDPKYSPDGKWIAFISLEHDGFESDKRRLMLYNRSTGAIKEITKNFDNWVEEYVWHPDSKSIFYTAEDLGTVKIFRIALTDIEIAGKTLKEGEWETIADGRYDYGSGLSVSNDGSQLIFGKESMIEPNEIFGMSLSDGKQYKITYSNPDFANTFKMPVIEEKWITSTDGAKVHCWIVYPPDFDSTASIKSGKKYPLLTYCQGGPQSMIGQRFHFRWNHMLMASHGYISILPNRRGVPGFGQKWNDAISQDWAGKPMQDIMSATDYMLKQKYIDKKASAAIGASAGGYAVFWLAGNHGGRYQAFMSHCGVFNLESMYGATEELWFPNWEYGGPYWDPKNKESYDKNSPHRFSKNWNTPILISTGERDFRVPFTQSLEAFTVAQVKGIDSKLIIFPNETHFISRQQEFIVWDAEVFEFLDKYCKHTK